MQETQEMTAAIAEWQGALNELVNVSYETAQLTAESFAAEQMGPNVDRLVDAVLGSNERLMEFLNEPLDSGDDLDAQDRLFGLLYGTLVGADALSSAGEEPLTIAASLRIGAAERWPTDSWRDEISDAAAILSSTPTLAGAAGEPVPVELDETIDHLSTTAGSELRSIVTDTAVTLVIPQLPGAVAAVVGGQAGKLITGASHYISGLFARVKKAASRLIQWVVDRAHKILPPPLYSVVSGFVASSIDDLKDRADQLIGSLAATAMGKHGVEAAWSAASDAQLAAALPRLSDATAIPVKRIGQVTSCRTFIDKWFKSLISQVSKVPAVAIGIAATAAAVIILVLYELWRGLHQIEGLVSAPPIRAPRTGRRWKL